jgi:dipeptidyl aminopeptidase/acylaminoacyl peptidase
MSEEKPRRRITAADLVGQRTPQDPALAPDGEHVAFVLHEIDFAKSEVRAQVWLGPAPDGPHSRYGAQQLTRGLADACMPEWSPDGADLAVLTFRAQPHEEEEDDRTEEGAEKRQVHLVPLEGGDPIRVTERPEGVDAFRWWPDGSGIVSLGPAHRAPAEREYRRHRRENLDDPHVVHDDIRPSEIWLHPLSGRARRLLPPVRGLESFDISPDGRLLAYATNHTGRPDDIDRTEVILRDLETGEERRLTGGRGGSESGPRFTKDGRFVLLHGWADPKIAFSRQELIAVRIDGGSFEVSFLLEETDRDLEEFTPLADGTVAVLVAEGLESRLLAIDPATGAVTTVPVEGRVMTDLSAGAKPGTVVLLVEDDRSMPDVFCIDIASAALTRVSDLHPEAEEWATASRRRVKWENEGFVHEGLVLTPAAPVNDTPPPLLVWIHGGPHWRVVDTLRVDEVEAIVAEGYAVFMPQYRGSSGSGQDYSMGSRRDLGGADARDVLAGLDHVLSLGVGDPRRLAVAGASYGGYLANWLVATTPRFRAGVSIAGIFDLTHDYSTSDYASWETHYLGGTPWESPELYRERSPLTNAASIEAPILILHGLDDETSFFTNSKGLYRALTELDRTTELVLYPREGHGLFDAQEQIS